MSKGCFITIKIGLFLLLCGPLGPVQVGFAQLSGSLLAEAQVGNIPHNDPADLTTSYAQLNLRYRQNRVLVFVRAEQFYSRFKARNYSKLTQYTVQYAADGLRVQFGHFYDMIGRGLLLRAYEIPGTILESQASRVRQGFYRDLFGLTVEGRWKGLRFKALRGTSLVNTLPATLEPEDRRDDLVEAVELRYQQGPIEVGGAILRNNFQDAFQEYATLFTDIRLSPNWSFYGELAQRIGEGYRVFDYSGDDRSFALYGSLNFFYGPLSLSAEYKNYRNFALSTGFNDPPAVIKQHTYLTLNRSTHVPFLFHESGAQLDGFYLFAPNKRLTLNVAQTENDLIVQKVTFREIFLEYSTPLGSAWSVKLFADYAEDPFKLEDHRYTGGLVGEYTFPSTLAVSATVEYQWIERNAFRPSDGSTFVDGMNNAVLRGSVSKGDVRVSAVVEATTDPLQTDRPDTIEIETDRRFFVGGSIAYAYKTRHYVSLFAGTRRGGPACTGGICYEVLDFSGVELRFTTKF